MAPGPTPLPPEVIAAAAQQMQFARTPAFVAAQEEAIASLRRVAQTEHGEPLIFAATGSGAMASAVTNLVAPGQKAIMTSCGNFGERWVKIAADHGVEVVHLAFAWGSQVDPAAVATAVADHPDAEVVFTTQSETSTGVVNDIEAIREAAGNRILVVDAVSGFGVVDLPMDAWGIDVVVTGSQKGLMTPPGLGVAIAGPRALERAEELGSGGYYFGWKRTLDGQNTGRTPFTPAVSLVFQLNAALSRIEAEGLDAVFERHRILGRACREGVRALGLEVLADENPEAGVVTAVLAPSETDGKAIMSQLKAQSQIQVAGGQGDLSGKIFRIGHCGWFSFYDILTTLSALELALAALGREVEAGAGVSAAQQVMAAAAG